MPKYRNPPGPVSDVCFLGWQKTVSGDFFPLYNINVVGHPFNQSTVGEATLRKLGLRVPLNLPSPPEIRPFPWHNPAIELNHPKTAKEAIVKAGLAYTVVKMQLGSNQDDYAIVRSDTYEVLGHVNSSYEPIQNINAFAFFDALVAEDKATYETAGVLGKGERIWILAKLPGCITVHGNDIVNKYLLLINSHDGSLHFRLKLTPIRVVCNNTLTSALQGAGEVQFNHTPETQRDLEQTLAMLGLSDSLYEKLSVIFNGMAARKITDDQLQKYVQELIPDNEEALNTARTENMRNSVIGLHESGRGAHLARGTVWGAFNSVAEYTDHMMSGEDSTTRLNSIWFGQGECLKLKAFRLAEKLMAA